MFFLRNNPGRQRMFLIVYTLALCVLIAVLGYKLFSPKTAPERRTNGQEDASEMGGESSRISKQTPERETFKTAYAQLDGKTNEIPLAFFEKYYDSIGPETMLSVLNENKFCHEQAHNLGRAIYDHTKNLAAATSICKTQCTGGCIHGVLMKVIAEDSPAKKGAPGDHASINDLTTSLRNKLATMCENNAITRYTGTGDCYHAMGHALLTLAEYDVHEGLELCKIFSEKGNGPVYFCATGIFMERDLMHGEADKLISNVYPCDTSDYPAACFRYKLRHVFDLTTEYTAGAQFCLTLAGNARSGCFHGLGFGAHKAVYRNENTINAICGLGSARDKKMCLEGVFGKINVYDTKYAQTLCASYDTGDKAICTAASTMRNFSTKRDFTEYSK
jgi:hypothetical protein